MELKEGMKVKFKPLEKVNLGESPRVVGEMKRHLGKVVTIETIYSREDDQVIFSIKEDFSRFIYGSHCIEGIGSIIPEELFEI